MAQERRSEDAFDEMKDVFDDDGEEDEEDESDTFGLDDLNKRRCGRCKHRPLLPYVYEGFTVLYCTRDKAPVCNQCYYPGLEPSHASPSSGLICTKCGKVYTHAPTR